MTLWLLPWVNIVSAKKVGDKTGGLFDLNTKLQNHTGIKIHNCHYCGKGFAYKKGLRRHIRNMHEMDHIPVKNELMDEDDPDFTFGGKYCAISKQKLVNLKMNSEN